jgi:hypothetical protein
MQLGDWGVWALLCAGPLPASSSDIAVRLVDRRWKTTMAWLPGVSANAVRFGPPRLDIPCAVTRSCRLSVGHGSSPGPCGFAESSSIASPFDQRLAVRRSTGGVILGADVVGGFFRTDALLSMTGRTSTPT